MTASRLPFVALLASVTFAACLAPGAGDEVTSETTSHLSVTSWTPPSDTLDLVGHPPHMATLNGTTYYVFTGDTALPFTVSDDLYWAKRTGNTWSAPQRITGQQTPDRVSLAAFNGFIYMVHSGGGTDLWFSRFDPATEQWSTNILLPYTTFGGPPALAAFNNQLYLVGTQEHVVTRHGVAVTTYPMWYATMTTAEEFSAAQPIPGQESASRPSAAAFADLLFVAHRNGQTAEIVWSYLAPGTAWSAPKFISAGAGGAAIQGDDVQIAEANGWLHLVHRRFDSNRTYWTYFDTCAWAPEAPIDAFSADYALSMNTSPEGLTLARVVNTGLWPYTVNHWFESRFLAPPPPSNPFRCIVVYTY
jgi:hypothetical protein